MFTYVTKCFIIKIWKKNYMWKTVLQIKVDEILFLSSVLKLSGFPIFLENDK